MTGTRPGEKTSYYWEDLRRRTEIDNVGILMMKNRFSVERMSPHAREAYMDYKATYKVDPGNICHHGRGHGKPEDVTISNRGNVCEHIPFLALTCRQILGEMWNLLPAGRNRKNEEKDYAQRRRYQATVTNFDFLPLYRFLQMLRKLPTGTHVKGAMVDVVLKESDGKTTYGCRYRNIRRIITKHWLENVPVWGCMTGLRECPDADGWRRFLETKIKNNIGTWFYRIRQVVALYRIDNKVWQATTIPYIKSMDEIMRNPADWGTIAEDELISETIDFVSSAILYQCGYIGKWKNQAGLEKRDREERESQLDKNDVAGEKEHAHVHLAEQYCVRVDKMLREVLGDFYNEWEQLEDQRLVPKDILF